MHSPPAKRTEEGVMAKRRSCQWAWGYKLETWAGVSICLAVLVPGLRRTEEWNRGGLLACFYMKGYLAAELGYFRSQNEEITKRPRDCNSSILGSSLSELEHWLARRCTRPASPPRWFDFCCCLVGFLCFVFSFNIAITWLFHRNFRERISTVCF